jgi:hypothetical protein
MTAPPESQKVMQSTCHDHRIRPPVAERAAVSRVAHAGNISVALKIFPAARSVESISRAHLHRRPWHEDRRRWHESCCAATVAKLSEADRIRLVVERDGLDLAIEWVRRTLQIYVRALDDPASYARAAEYRPRFEQSIQEFEAWLTQRGARTTAAG